MALEDALERYPKPAKLKDGSRIVVRPLQPADEKPFHKFFVDVPETERILFKHRVTDPKVIRDWCRHIDYGKILPLLAWDANTIVADASLHQSLGGWKRHVGRISLFVHPQYRGKGVAGLMVSELIDLARESGLEKLEAEFLGEQAAGRVVFAKRGFHEILSLKDYVKDMQALPHDYVLMGRDLVTDEEYAGAQ
jgi:GNAT superfamily N-acetyltransferase